MAPHFKKIIIPTHLFGFSAIVLALSGTVNTSWFWATFVGWIMISGFGIAIGFHRLISHHAFETHPWIRIFLAYLGGLGAEGSAVFWASVHNGLHHPYSDSKKDLHSPIHGKFRSYIGWQIDLKPEDVPFRIGARLIREPALKFLHKNYNLLYWGTSGLVAIISWKLALYGLLLPGMISLHQENCINLFCHISTGYRNHETKDQSTNNLILGYLAFGQGWHNNHHARPNDFDYGGDRWWEFDICSVLVPLIAKRKDKAVSIKSAIVQPTE